ncbi:C40 family peptidase [Streptomyces sp. SL54]|uniref:C40 family peptidase n=1 Tax=Streptantibioticus silvisoli TaxID=2705255 RepID=A0ABT6W767_9ACTN|nr:C40 family peptidase [Streptantibioticus silvisoli]
MAHITFLVRIAEFLIAMSAMSPTQNRIPLSDTPAGRRRHARHTESHWVKRAGVATGVVGAAILSSGAAAPASATPSNVNPLNEITQTLSLSQLRAADATAQVAVDYQLQASQAQATEAALKSALHHKQADRKKAAAAARAKARAKKAAAEKAAARPMSLAADATSTHSTASSASSAVSGSVAAVVSFVQAQVGKSYVMGATGPDAYDCSGLVQAAYRTIGVDLPRVSEDQSTAGTQVSLSDLQPGDILYWGGAGSAYHVAIYIGGGNFIGAQNPSSGVVEHPLSYDEPTGAVRVA